ncbi:MULTISPECIES: NADPH-dependent oxidoreductase [Agrobacterium tumefaciens complex]|uniref:Nitroreductase n=1 Tax=Agrobacterium radiobacter TaxID=362 RepID=A0ABR6JAU8_AGRRD|nr:MULTISPECIES: NADPH-dependent oxidoreductase [Agrobacterium tumefaciens complex]TGE77576.1 NADPH-dependent oxidoreductase [Rhizobium sp. SEMIA 439]KAA1233299.1 NADPH-dependent oxidoreductase [Agrobacterium tumefaciens]MBB4283378.1 nitroreductase [Agrobacterium radiobacter]MBB4320073.1 nitroreductase [Agrobacterium radiobacter]MBB4325299.1 nitroreductase [Agrobacterium radiobacter]
MTLSSPITKLEIPQQRVEARYGTQADFSPPFWNDTIDALLNHRTARAYLPKALPEGSLELLVAAAQSAPTSSNLQAWSVVAVQDKERKARLAGFTGGNAHIKGAPVFLIWLIDLKRLRTVASNHGNSGEGLDYLESFLIGAIDAALAAQNAVAAIDSLGLGSCYVGGIRNRPEDVSRELNLPPETIAVFGLTVGYPDPAVKTDVKPRLPQSSILFHETYSEAARDDLDSYDAVLKTFQEKQGLPQNGWTAPISQRVENAAALKGRAELSQTLRRLGFGIK